MSLYTGRPVQNNDLWIHKYGNNNTYNWACTLPFIELSYNLIAEIKKMSDVYAYGMISASTVYLLDPDFSYPPPNQYAEVKNILYSVGGEAINSAIILSKLGLRTKVDGNWLSPSTSNRTLELLQPYDIDTSRLLIKEGYGTDEIVITDKTSRTIFGNYASFHNGEKQWNEPNEDDIKSSSIVALDPYFKPEAEQAAQLCHKHSVPYVTLDCEYSGYIAQHAAALVISHELRDQAYPDEDIPELIEKYQETCTGLIIFTFGSDKLLFTRRNQEIKTFPPFKVESIDTTGAGDSFRAGITYGLHMGWSDEKVIEFASAVAANVCMSLPHTLNAPGLTEIMHFISSHQNTNNA